MIKSKVLGIEIGNMGLKLVVAGKRGILQYVIKEIPADLLGYNQIDDWERMGELIRMAVRENGIRVKNAAIVLPENISYLRRLECPMMKDAQLYASIPFEFQDLIKGDKDRFYYDYEIIREIELPGTEEPGKGKKGRIRPDRRLEIMASAIEKDLMKKYKAMLKKAGLRMVYAAPESLAYQNLMKQAFLEHPGEENPDFVVLALGYKSTQMRIFTGGAYETGRVIDLCIKNLWDTAARVLGTDVLTVEKRLMENKIDMKEFPEIRGVCERIALEVQRSINFFSYTHQNSTLDKIYCCGRGYFYDELVEIIESMSGLPVMGIDELFDDQPQSREAFIYGAAAVGMAWNQEG